MPLIVVHAAPPEINFLGVIRGIFVTSAACKPAARPAPGFCVRKTAKKMWRGSLVLAAVAVMAGCAGPTRTGATLDAVNKTAGAPKAGHARIVVMRPKAFGGIFDTGWEVRLDDSPMGDLKTGTFVYRDRPAGRHELSFLRPGDLARSSRQEIVAVPGRTQFYRLELNEKGRMIAGAQAAAGLTGWFLASAVSDISDERGLFDFVPVDDPIGREEIAGLRLAD